MPIETIMPTQVAATATESFKTADILVITTAAVSMAVVAVTLMFIVYFFYRVREDVTLLNELKARTSSLEKKNDEGDYVSDQITNVLYDLYSLISDIKGIVELQIMGYVVNDKLFDKMEADITSTEKHFAEIGLLSVDKERRISSQQSLANLCGDFDSLKIMNSIVSRKFGIVDKELPQSIRRLEQRIARIVVDASTWTGRPSGGAF